MHKHINPNRRLWIAGCQFEELETEAIEKSPLETGGVLLGYWGTDNQSDAIVTHIIGPGPKAIHCKTRFVPDHEFQLAQLSKIYEESGRQTQYLGDWHTHPGGTGYPSEQDRTTIFRIARCRTARVQRPIMLIVYGGPCWSAYAWQCLRPKLLCRNGVVQRIAIEIFDA